MIKKNKLRKFIVFKTIFSLLPLTGLNPVWAQETDQETKKKPKEESAFCSFKPDQYQPVRVNFNSNTLVDFNGVKVAAKTIIAQAVKKLNLVDSDSLSPYNDVATAFGVRDPKEVTIGKLKVLGPTYRILTQICGEYRDNPEMLETRFKWLANMNILGNEEQQYDHNQDLWSQITGEGYQTLMKVIELLNEHREDDLSAIHKNMVIGKSKAGKVIVLGLTHVQEIDLHQVSLPPFSLCEFRFILSEKAKGKKVKDIAGDHAEYLLNYTGKPVLAYEKIAENDVVESAIAGFQKDCSKQDLTTYLDFRGDGYLREKSIESNGNNWYARMYASACTWSKTKLKYTASTETALTDQDCKNYFDQPYATRTNHNLKGYLRLLFYPERIKASMDDFKGTIILFLEDLNQDGIGELAVLKSNGEDADQIRDLRTAVDNAMAAFSEVTRPDKGELDFLGDDTKKAESLISEAGKIRNTVWKLYQKGIHLTVLKALFKNEKALSKVSEEKKNSLAKVLEKANQAAAKDYQKIKDFAAEEQNVVQDLSASQPDFDYSEYVTSTMLDHLEENEEIFERFLGNKVGSAGIDFVLDNYLDPRTGEEVNFSTEKSLAELSNVNLEELFGSKENVWQRLKVMLDRHTDWYKMDMVELGSGLFKATYSPFVASSYYMNKSHPFTIPGYAMGTAKATDPMQWMFVQTFKHQDWYNTYKLKHQTVNKVDIFNTWWDELTFSVSGLGAEETGMDRFAAPKPEEMGAILYLKRIPRFDLKH
jgi:hypothetical protein